ncbi:hypothetical protein JCM11251_000799 [Rhodosporidiobolus azoricus]
MSINRKIVQEGLNGRYDCTIGGMTGLSPYHLDACSSGRQAAEAVLKRLAQLGGSRPSLAVRGAPRLLRSPSFASSLNTEYAFVRCINADEAVVEGPTEAPQRLVASAVIDYLAPEVAAKWRASFNRLHYGENFRPDLLYCVKDGQGRGAVVDRDARVIFQIHNREEEEDAAWRRILQCTLPNLIAYFDIYIHTQTLTVTLDLYIPSSPRTVFEAFSSHNLSLSSL